MQKPSTVDEYLAGIADDKKRAALDELRRVIRSIVPDAEECISYGMPGFRKGKVFAGFAATKSGCSYYPHSGRVVDDLRDDLAGYSATQGAVHFTPDAPLPEPLVRKLIASRMAEER